MEARWLRLALVVCCWAGLGASYRTTNFIISAPTPQLAKEVGDAAEVFRRDLAIEWLGRELPRWPQPCPITVQCAPNLGAGGMTSFVFHGNQPHDFRMSIQGSRERLLDSVLPHEVTHTIFATHFGRPLPRWADEGACTTVEHDVEKNKQHRLLYEFLTTGRGIAFNQMFAMKEYPRDILPLYAQGFSLAKFFIAQGGKRKFVEYVGDGMNSNNWTSTTQKHYGYQSLSELQTTWLEWVRKGCPPIDAPRTQPEVQLAAATEAPSSSAPRQPAPGAYHLAGGAGGSELVRVVAAPGSLHPAHGEPTRGATRNLPAGNTPWPAQQLAAAEHLAASHQAGGSWYARQRDAADDLAMAERSTAPSAAPPTTLNPLRATAPETPPHLAATAIRSNDGLAWATPVGRQLSPGGAYAATGPGAVASPDAPVEQSVTRPTAMEQPRQIILEWNRLPPGMSPPQYR